LVLKGKNTIYQTILAIYFRISNTIEKQNVNLMQFVLAFVCIWFGILKLIKLSPAVELVEKTVFFLFNPELFIPILG
jgi:hypothetical protein